jgi:hypothetical protein
VRELASVIVQETGGEFMATGRDKQGGYLGTEFAATRHGAITAVFNRAKAAGHKVVKQNVETVTEKPKRPAKVGPDRITTH